MTLQKRFTLSIVAGVVASLLIIFHFFQNSYWVGVCLLLVHQQLRKPFHNFDPKAYPAFFKFVTLAPWMLLVAFIFVPLEAKYVVRLLFGISIGALTFSFSYLDYRILKKGAYPGAELPVVEQPGAEHPSVSDNLKE